MSKIKTSFNVVEEKSARLAVLIDADNASAKSMKAILEEVATFGEATVKRIYGNFVGTKNSSWTQVINEHAIKPMQQFEFTTGKNATDGYMIIDAMDLLYTGRFDGFCIVSSDSDFTALAIRLKEQGVTVYGFGRKQTPAAFIKACSQFIYVENLSPVSEEMGETKSGTVDKTTHAEEKKMAQTDKTEMQLGQEQESAVKLPKETIKKVFEQLDNEWITAAALGSQWKLLQVDFDSRTYGFKKLTDLVKNHPELFEYKMQKNSEGIQEHMYVRLKN